MNPSSERCAARAPLFSIHPLTLPVLALLSVTATSVHAQSTPRVSNTLPVITITGNPNGATDLIAPAEAYSGAALLLRSRSTLGETLDGTPGVSSSYFGPNASRPLIRGLDGDRVRILQNSGASVDASGLSNDHAVPSDPISMERVEVLRGPGALMYGGSAVGGVVNVIDNRIPQERQFDANGGLSGKLSLDASSGNTERSGAALLEAGTDRFALHADVFRRSSGNVAVPIALTCAKEGSPAVANALCNSAASSSGGAVGGAVFLGHSRLGASASSYRSDYGTVAEDGVTIGMRSDRTALEWDVGQLGGWIHSIKLQAGHSDYQHTEYEDGAPGTVFRNSGNDVRLLARHAPVGNWLGVVGLQGESTRFSADGEEAFAPHSRTRQMAVFALEELPLSWGRFSLGARLESVQVESDGNPLVERFVPGSRAFNPRSLALGTLWNAAPQWHITSNLAYSERAPKDYELFADGPHLATHAYEVGLRDATLESSTNWDLGAKWKQGANAFGISAFVNQFANYLALEASGAVRGDEELPEYVYTQVPARFTGLEASGKLRLLDAGQTLDLELRSDWVRAINTRTGAALPRVAPLRVGASLLWGAGPWSARLDANHAAAQTEVPEGQTPSQAYTLVNASLAYRQRAGAAELLWFARADNLGDVLAYSPTSVLTQTAPGRAPLPGRSLKVGVQVAF